MIKMILKITLSKEDGQTEVFQISNYYSEAKYLEADINRSGASEREIILNNGLYLGEEDNWEQMDVLTDQGIKLINFINTKE